MERLAWKGDGKEAMQLALLDKAKELGEVISQSEEYEELQVAQGELDKDEVAQRLIQEVQSTQKRMEMANNAGMQPSQEQIAEMEKKREEMNGNETVQSYIQAHQKFNSLMNEVNEAITGAMTGKSE